MILKSFTDIENEIKKRKVSIAFLPIGCTEQHGPFLPLETDSIIASAIALQVSEILSRKYFCYAFPAINYTPTRSNRNFTGTISVSENAFREYLGDILNGLKDSPFNVVFIINAHGPAYPSIQELVFKIVHNQFCDKVQIKPFYCIDIFDVSKSINEKFGLEPGKHADWFEFLLSYRILGKEYYNDERIKEIYEYSKNFKFSLDNSSLIGVPMEYRSVDGIIGHPLPKEIDNIDKWSEKIWNEIISNVELKITGSIINFKY